jgi:solute carrier family 25 phosphate transporter 3
LKLLKISLKYLVFVAEQYSCEMGTPKFYAYCAMGGVISCGLTHTAVVSLDLVKCRLQVCDWM